GAFVCSNREQPLPHIHLCHFYRSSVLRMTKPDHTDVNAPAADCFPECETGHPGCSRRSDRPLRSAAFRQATPESPLSRAALPLRRWRANNRSTRHHPSPADQKHQLTVDLQHGTFQRHRFIHARYLLSFHTCWTGTSGQGQLGALSTELLALRSAASPSLPFAM